MRVLLLAIIMLAENIPLSETEHWHLDAVNTKITLAKTQQAMLQVEFQRLSTQIADLEKEHDGVVMAAYLRAHLNQQEWTLDENLWAFKKIERPKDEQQEKLQDKR